MSLLLSWKFKKETPIKYKYFIIMWDFILIREIYYSVSTSIDIIWLQKLHTLVIPRQIRQRERVCLEWTETWWLRCIEIQSKEGELRLYCAFSLFKKRFFDFWQLPVSYSERDCVWSKMANQVDNDVHIRGSVYYKKRPNIVPEPRGSLLGAEKIKEWTSNSNAPSFVATTTYTYENCKKRWHGRSGKVGQ